MQKDQTNQNICEMSLADLRQLWSQYWGMTPHDRIGRAMLEKSIEFKIREQRGEGLNPEQLKRVEYLIAAFKRNPKFFDEGLSELKPGIRLVKNYNGEHHSVTVLEKGYEYRDKTYGSLSEIASVIAGTRWNGWVFFGLKKRGGKS